MQLSQLKRLQKIIQVKNVMNFVWKLLSLFLIFRESSFKTLKEKRNTLGNLHLGN